MKRPKNSVENSTTNEPFRDEPVRRKKKTATDETPGERVGSDWDTESAEDVDEGRECPVDPTADANLNDETEDRE